MADISAARERPVDQFFDETERVHAGMLGVDGSGLHMQPMAPQVDRDARTIWFFTKSDTALVRAITPGARAHFTLVGKDHDYHACVGGPIEQRRDPEIIDRYWNSVIAAWFEGGTDDPKLTLLALKPQDGEAWASTDSALKFGWEIARANLSDEHQPEVGVQVDLRF